MSSNKRNNDYNRSFSEDTVTSTEKEFAESDNSINDDNNSLHVNMSEPDEFNCIEIHSCLKQIADLKGFEEFEYAVDCLNGNGVSFVANIFRVIIKNATDNNDCVNVILKTLINTVRQETFYDLHYREVTAYNRVINNFIDLQNSIDKDSRITLPVCLYSNTEVNNEVIILNDLRTQGYKLDDKQSKFEYLNLEQVKSVICELAKFHGLSFVFEKKQPDLFYETTVNFNDIIFDDIFLDKSDLRNYFIESFEMSLNLVTDKEVQTKLIKINSLLELLKFYTTPGKRNVFCHGDCGVNNMLFKYENSKTKVCFIDFQAMRFANPMTDLMSFLYTCTESKFRSEHINELKDTYYNSLASFLALYDIDISIAYQEKKEYDLDFEKHRGFGLLVAMIEMRTLAAKSEEDAGMKGLLASNWDLTEVLSENDLYKHRVNDLFQDIDIDDI